MFDCSEEILGFHDNEVTLPSLSALKCATGAMPSDRLKNGLKRKINRCHENSSARARMR